MSNNADGNSILTPADILANAEAVRHGPPPSEQPPHYPTSFGPDFVPPAHSTKSLQTKFAMDRDKRIVFHEIPHVYLIDGIAYDCSVTTLVKQHSEEFNAQICIARMRNSRKEGWPRFKYAVEPVRIGSVAEAALLHPSGYVLLVDAQTESTPAAIELSEGTEMAEKMVCSARESYASRRQGADLHMYVTPRAMTNDEIIAMWETNKVEAANKGTWIHWQLELWSNSLPCYVDTELLLGLRFVGEVLRPMGVRCWATEKEVFGENERVCGSIDWIGYYEDDPDSLIIVDWKRSKKLDSELISAYRKRMTSPLNHLDDADGCKYALQLGCYAFLLEKYYGKKVRALALCCVHEAHPINTFVPYLRAEVAYLMRKRRETVAARIRVDLDDVDGVLPRCALTGSLLYDGVWVRPAQACGKTAPILCNRKDAIVHHEHAFMWDAIEETAQVQCRLDDVTCVVSEEEAALESCRPWAAQMPMNGIPTPIDQSVRC